MIEVTFDFANDQEAVDISAALLEKMRAAACAVLENEDLQGHFEISLTILDKPAMQALNALHRNIDKVTDVLSFPLSEDGNFPLNNDTGAFLLGDIVICAERAVEQAAEYGHGVEREFGFLCAHSVLHLLGYDHVGSEEAAAVMEAKQEQALNDVGLLR